MLLTKELSEQLEANLWEQNNLEDIDNLRPSHLSLEYNRQQLRIRQAAPDISFVAPNRRSLHFGYRAQIEILFLASS